jgi:hypothetical protein
MASYLPNLIHPLYFRQILAFLNKIKLFWQIGRQFMTS